MSTLNVAPRRTAPHLGPTQPDAEIGNLLPRTVFIGTISRTDVATPTLFVL